MNSKWALLLALSGAATVAACGSAAQDKLITDDGDEETLDDEPGTTPKKPGTKTDSGTATPPATGGDTPTPTPGVENGTAKQTFFDKVFPSLSGSCGGCHDVAGPGPSWLFKADKDKTYITFENLGYISAQSRITLKGAHGAAPALTADQQSLFTNWVGLEIAARGNQAPTNIKEKLGTCFDKAKFDAIGLQNLRVTRRQNENNNNCTGCRDGTQCMTCHVSDPATGVVLAYNNNNVPADYTFTMAKQLPFMDLVIGTNGADVVGSKKLALKSDATVKDKPYTHPMYTIPATMQAQIDAFAADVATKYKAGQCK